jgi:phospholipase/carboxylesterase
VKRRHWLYLALAVVAVSGIVRWRPWLPRLEALHKGGKGPPTLVLLHGYASSAEHWIPYGLTIPFPPQGRFLFPVAPYHVSRPDGKADGRAWWNLELAAHRRTVGLGVDLREEDPSGLMRAAGLVRNTLDAEGNTTKHPFILGGFSQGAMVSCEVAFASNEPLAALVILSGTPIDRAGWSAGMSERKAMPVFMAHGRADDVLPFDLAEKLHQQMVIAGLSVTFVAFEGGHEIPAEVVAALGTFLARTAAGRSRLQ